MWSGDALVDATVLGVTTRFLGPVVGPRRRGPEGVRLALRPLPQPGPGGPDRDHAASRLHPGRRPLLPVSGAMRLSFAKTRPVVDDGMSFADRASDRMSPSNACRQARESAAPA